ncbi:MAG: hypothetical protein MUC56_07355 [Thermoanaerobaculales bacterium]|jgi:hypothetical protein|nr:hypothetical protein [Thermoanaerobaculales bacterium]
MSWFLFSLVILLSSVPFAEGDQKDSQFPGVIGPKACAEQSGPVWVTAARAVDANGNIDWSLLGEQARRRFETVLQREELEARNRAHAETRVQPLLESKGSDCLNLADSIAPMTGIYRGRVTAETLIKGAAVVFHGRISAIDFGFYLGRPGSLLKVVPDFQAKSHHTMDPFSFSYVYFFNGSFTAGNTSFCNEHSLFPYSPVVGDEITVVSTVGGVGEDGRFFEADGFVLFPSPDRALLSPMLTSSSDLKAARTSNDVEQYVLKVLSSPRGEDEPEVY